jgi:hypothetical protein
MERIIKTGVTWNAEGLTLLSYLAGRFTYRSPAEWSERIANHEITVNGQNVEPEYSLTLHDVIEYRPGDILVFPYKKGELLVHRYVGERGGRILCKGDNAFRLEDIGAEDIIGKVESVLCQDGEYPVPDVPEGLTELSLRVGRLFRQNKYDRDATMRTTEYEQFRDAVTACAAFRQKEVTIAPENPLPPLKDAGETALTDCTNQQTQ